MASKTKKALVSIYALGSSKFFLSIIIIAVISAIFPIVDMVVSDKVNINMLVDSIFAVSILGVSLFEIYGAILIYCGCKNSEISAHGFSLVYRGTLISTALGLIYYILAVVSVTTPLVNGFNESIFAVLFTAFFLVFDITFALPFLIVELKAILYLKDIEKNITVRPKKLKALFIVELLTLIGMVIMLFVDVFDSMSTLVSDVNVLGAVTFVMNCLNHSLSIVSSLLCVILIVKFNKIINTLIHKEN